MPALSSLFLVLLVAGMITAIALGSVAISRSNSANLVMLNATQTLTNKTLTSPSVFHIRSTSTLPVIVSGAPFTSGSFAANATDTSGTIIASLTNSTNPTTASFTVRFSQPYTTRPGTVIIMTPKIPGYTVPREVTVDWNTTSFTITEIFSAVFTEVNAEMYHYIVI